MKKTIYLFVCLFICCTSIMAQNSISGTITNTKNKALVGANVYITGTSIGTATNKNGYFKLKNISNGEHEITISYSGYKRIKQKIKLPTDKNALNFSMTTKEMPKLTIFGN